MGRRPLAYCRQVSILQYERQKGGGGGRISVLESNVHKYRGCTVSDQHQLH